VAGFVGHNKFDNVTVALLETRVPSFDTVIYNALIRFILSGTPHVTIH